MSNFRETINKEEVTQNVESKYINKKLPTVLVGDIVKLGFLIKEGNKERTQYYEGIVISKKNTGINKTIIVRRIFRGVGIERSFLIYSPKLTSCEIKRSSKVRKAKLYYLKRLYGKSVKLKQQFN
jgi:large subunit ribosomal protein L19